MKGNTDFKIEDDDIYEGYLQHRQRIPAFVCDVAERVKDPI